MKPRLISVSLLAAAIISSIGCAPLPNCKHDCEPCSGSHSCNLNAFVIHPTTYIGVSSTILHTSGVIVADIGAVASGSISPLELQNFNLADLHVLIRPKGGVIATSSGVLVATITGPAGVLATHQFGYYISGDALYLSDPAEVESYLSPNVNEATGIEVSADVPLLGLPGTPISVTTVIESGDVDLGGASGVFYSVYPKCPPQLRNCQPK